MGRRIGFGILLILVGVFLLFLFAGGYTWDWSVHWPFLLILFGLMDVIDEGWRGLRGGGGFIILIGGFLLLFTMRVVDWQLSQVWPAVLILLGLLSLVDEKPSLSWAIILIGGGAFLLALTTGRIAGGWNRFWPVILILAGLAALVGGEEKREHERRLPPAAPPKPRVRGEEQPPDRLEVLEMIRSGKITAEEGVDILEGNRRPPKR